MQVSLMIRPAQPMDAPILTALALASKAYWGYDTAFMAACVREMTITATDIERHPTFVLTDGQIIHGFAMLEPHADRTIELDALFLAPASIGHGYGRLLFEHAKQVAQHMGFQTMLIQADPHAEAFYLRMGAQRVGSTPSNSIPGRMLPQLALDLEQQRGCADQTGA